MDSQHKLKKGLRKTIFLTCIGLNEKQMATKFKDFMAGYKTYDDSEGRGSRKEWKRVFNERMSNEEAQTIMEDQKETPYTILNISTSASQEEIKRAFKTLIIRWHPDKNPDNQQEAEAMSKKIIASYTLLSNK